MRNMNSSTKNPGRMYTIKLTGIIPGAGLKTSIYDLKSGKHSFKRLCEDHKQFLILTKHLKLTVLVVVFGFVFFFDRFK